ncbi:hypothetical protein EDC19_1395 [Natranaerovirga hydrolytica]|uniref:Uncharacterized protein n=1 Tax=Natranaerovirga hydrolytica TaxID=680378 RepID=A0A4R1ML34_9FIRM|nr:hypothetical protein [Natranaerovirga hydrolytica]TCK93205.1 hypothetical protein EDC19_1395 [Natranaerovirga hydrolytica]
MKKILIVAGSMFVIVGLLYIKIMNTNISNQIINYIDENGMDNNSCIFSMNDITRFEWDRMLIYQVGSSNIEISDALNVEYKDSVDLVSGIIFVKDSNIVYQEKIPYNPEKPDKLSLYVGSIFGEDNYATFTPSNAFFKGVKSVGTENVYYQIRPVNDSNNYGSLKSRE